MESVPVATFLSNICRRQTDLYLPYRHQTYDTGFKSLRAGTVARSFFFFLQDPDATLFILIFASRQSRSSFPLFHSFAAATSQRAASPGQSRIERLPAPVLAPVMAPVLAPAPWEGGAGWFRRMLVLARPSYECS